MLLQRDSYIAPEHLALALLRDRKFATFLSDFQLEAVQLSDAISDMKRGPIKSRKAGQKLESLNKCVTTSSPIRAGLKPVELPDSAST